MLYVIFSLFYIWPGISVVCILAQCIHLHLNISVCAYIYSGLSVNQNSSSQHSETTGTKNFQFFFVPVVWVFASCYGCWLGENLLCMCMYVCIYTHTHKILVSQNSAEGHEVLQPRRKAASLLIVLATSVSLPYFSLQEMEWSKASSVCCFHGS